MIKGNLFVPFSIKNSSFTSLLTRNMNKIVMYIIEVTSIILYRHIHYLRLNFNSPWATTNSTMASKV